jgi:hypothetical protein
MELAVGIEVTQVTTFSDILASFVLYRHGCELA